MEEKKFRVLWLDDDFDPKSGNYEQMHGFRITGQECYPFEITTCVDGSEFIAYANEGSEWNVFILDIYGKMDIANNGDAADILDNVIEKTQDKVKKEGILLYCFSGNPSMKNRKDVGMRNGYLRSLDFQKHPSDNNQEEQYYYLKQENINILFDNMLDKLDSRVFKEHPEFDYLYRKVEEDGKRFIQGLYDWKMGNGLIYSNFAGLRQITKKVDSELSEKGFFKRYPQASKVGIIKLFTPRKLADFINARFDTSNPVLSDSCRSAWEALSIEFLFKSSDALAHPENFKEPEKNSSQNNLYSDCFYPALFNSFVIFAKWYKRFYEKFESEKFKMDNFINNQYFNQFMKQYYEQQKKYPGEI